MILSNIKFFAILTFCFLSNQIFGQNDVVKSNVLNNASKKSIGIYEDDFLSPEFHANKRQVLRDKMPEKSVAILFSNPVKNRSNDVDFQYHQDPNFYYLTGLREPNSMVVIFKEEIEIRGKKTNEIIFVQERNEKKEQWDGKRVGKEGLVNFFGFNNAFDNTELKDFPLDFSKFENIFYLPGKAEQTSSFAPKGSLNAMIKSFEEKTKNVEEKKDVKFLIQTLAEMREVKDDAEIELLEKAIDITCEAQKELMKGFKPEMKEYQAQAIVEFVFKMNGAEYPGFPSIIGSGENSCILHYTTNRKAIEKNDLIVVDIGAEYHGYTADVTRTIPANGKYSEEQLLIYNLVLKAQKAGFEACLVGNNFWQPNKEAVKVVQQGLMELGIIKKESDAKKYFMHGTSHYLGLDVHDVGLYGPFKHNTVITVEPGIYIPEGSDCDPKWWNIGVRIEDDVLITNEGYKILSDGVTRNPHEIEELMQSNFK
jgi:Xaa-Pro aminopeptidase